MPTLSSTEKGNVFTGPRAKLTVGTTLIGFLTDVSGSEELEYVPAELIGDVYVQEWIVVSYRCSLTAAKLRIVGATLKDAGIFPKHGGTSKDFLDNILALKDLNVVLEDQITKKAIATFTGVRVTSSNFSVSARGIVAENLTFLATRLYDESEIITSGT